MKLETTLESNVSGYNKSFPTTFRKAKNDLLTDVNGKVYIDFFAGAGALNYGHNNDKLREAILAFLMSDAPVHFLDMDSEIKLQFLQKFNEVILRPRNMNYKIQFPGPTGTNAVEAAIKLARKVTGRKTVFSFTHAFHGMTATSLALSGSQEGKHSCIPSQDIVFFPYDGFMGEGVNTIDWMEKLTETPGTGIHKPAAIILERIQAEGGVNIAGEKWLKQLEQFANRNGILLIIDEIQVGCGRTGNFFSFENNDISPDIILLSKSVSGYGLPLSVLLMKPELDQWNPGEHNGTFRANNLSLLAGMKAMEYWETNEFSNEILRKESIIRDHLATLHDNHPGVVSVRGKGLIWGIEMKTGELADAVSDDLFHKGLIIETCGNKGQVIKLLPALTITEENLLTGLEMILSTIGEHSLNYMTTPEFEKN